MIQLNVVDPILPLLSMALAVTVYVPEVVGVPLIFPSDVAVIPGGSRIEEPVELLARADPESDWAKASTTLAGSIDKDLPNQIDSARSNFRRFRRAILFHFYQVDRALRSQCEAILAIRAPLRSLLSEV